MLCASSGDSTVQEYKDRLKATQARPAAAEVENKAVQERAKVVEERAKVAEDELKTAIDELKFAQGRLLVMFTEHGLMINNHYRPILSRPINIRD